MAGSASARSARNPEPLVYRAIAGWRWLLIVASVAVGSALPVIWQVNQDDSYCAEAQVLIADSEAQVAIDGTSNIFVATRELANEVNHAYGDPVTDEIVMQLGYTPTVDIIGSEASDVLAFVGCEKTPVMAAESANTWAEVYVGDKQRQESGSIAAALEGFEERLVGLQARRTETRASVASLQARILRTNDAEIRSELVAEAASLEADLSVELQLLDTQIQTVAATATKMQLGSHLAQEGTARLIRSASVPSGPVDSPIVRNSFIGGMFGLLATGGALLLVESLNRSIKTVEDITGVAVLGSIPRPQRSLAVALPLATISASRSPVAEAYQQLRTAVDHSLAGRQIKSLLITSVDHGEGKTTTGCNLAFAMSATDYRVVLADIDFRKPGIHEVFRQPVEPGLSDHILHDIPLNKIARLVDAGHRNMAVIPVGIQPPDPADFVASPAFGRLVHALEQEADLVIFDASPVEPYPDVFSIAQQVDAVIVVAKARSTARPQLDAAVAALTAVGANVLGVCLVGVKSTAQRGRFSGPRPVPGGEGLRSSIQSTSSGEG